jgi:hypothetical protein
MVAECTPNVYGNKLIYIFLRKIDGLCEKKQMPRVPDPGRLTC